MAHFKILDSNPGKVGGQKMSQNAISGVGAFLEIAAEEGRRGGGLIGWVFGSTKSMANFGLSRSGPSRSRPNQHHTNEVRGRENSTIQEEVFALLVFVPCRGFPQANSSTEKRVQFPLHTQIYVFSFCSSPFSFHFSSFSLFKKTFFLECFVSSFGHLFSIFCCVSFLAC